jgi:NADH-quinone oxidoreductase subunit H
MKLGFYLFAEYINMFISGAVMATLYFGGYDYPGIDFVTAQFGSTVAGFVGMGALIGKALIFVFIFMWVRWTLPRFRYDQLMGLGWSGLIPLSMYNVVVTAFGILIGKPFTAGIVGFLLLIGGMVVYDQLFVKKKIA